ncbi:MAG: DUF6464 family protein [Cyanobacteriota bacterium]|nr:DUF6464 family protein [Cyanobacteriota bacterium]
MEPDSLSTEIILSKSARSLGKVRLDWQPQPGHYLEHQGKTYTVLERRHQYQFKLGRYRLHKIALYVQSANRPDEKSLIDGRWVVGDANCRYNARSELLRCAVNPEGPCDGCRYYQLRSE